MALDPHAMNGDVPEQSWCGETIKFLMEIQEMQSFEERVALQRHRIESTTQFLNEHEARYQKVNADQLVFLAKIRVVLDEQSHDTDRERVRQILEEAESQLAVLEKHHSRLQQMRIANTRDHQDMRTMCKQLKMWRMVRSYMLFKVLSVLAFLLGFVISVGLVFNASFLHSSGIPILIICVVVYLYFGIKADVLDQVITRSLQ